MAGIFEIASKEEKPRDLFLGTSYLQHRAQAYCGFVVWEGRSFSDTHSGLLKENFRQRDLNSIAGKHCLGCVSSDKQPVVEAYKDDTLVLALDGNIINYKSLREQLFASGVSFFGFKDPEQIPDIVIASKIISRERDFESGIERLVNMMEGDFAAVALNKHGVYAARGWGRKPLIIGKKDGIHAVASESNAFCNTEFEVVRDVNPGEIARINPDGVESIKQLGLNKPVKYCAFEWIYTAYPSSVIDGRSVTEVRKKLGSALAKKYPVNVDVISPIPNSGRWHAIGYAKESKMYYAETFIRYDYSDRSFTPGSQEARDDIASTKLIPVESEIRGNRIVVVDDSIVRGTQMLNRVKVLRELGAREVHARIACPPLMNACRYGKTTKKDDECIARRISIEEIRKKLKLDSLCYAGVEDLENAIGMPREKLCLECWGY